MVDPCRVGVPPPQILETTTSLKVARRVHAVLKRIVAGVLVNKGMTNQNILLLSHGLVSESLPLVTKTNKYGHARTHTHTNANGKNTYAVHFFPVRM